MAEYLIQGETLDDIADAINTKLDTSVAMTPAQMVTAIATIPSGGGSGIHEETGTVTSITGAGATTIDVPIADDSFDNLVIILQPIYTWVKENDEWVARQSLDFSGTTGFMSGNWRRFPKFIASVSQTTSYIKNDATERTVNSKAGLFFCEYSNATSIASYAGATPTISNNVATIPVSDSTRFDAPDCGITYKYRIWGWDND